MFKVASLMLCCAFVFGCSDQSRGRKQRETTHPTLEGTHWILEAVKGEPADRNGKAAYLELHAKDLRFSGNTGTNAINGTYLLNSDHGVRFTLGVSTKMAGDDQAMMQERQFLQALALAETFRISGRELSLLVDDQPVALFVAQ